MLYCLYRMKLIGFLLGLGKKKSSSTLAEYQRIMLVRAGGQQFKKLNELGLHIPVRLA